MFPPQLSHSRLRRQRSRKWEVRSPSQVWMHHLLLETKVLLQGSNKTQNLQNVCDERFLCVLKRKNHKGATHTSALCWLHQEKVFNRLWLWQTVALISDIRTFYLVSINGIKSGTLWTYTFHTIEKQNQLNKVQQTNHRCWNQRNTFVFSTHLWLWYQLESDRKVVPSFCVYCELWWTIH